MFLTVLTIWIATSRYVKTWQRVKVCVGFTQTFKKESCMHIFLFLTQILSNKLCWRGQFLIFNFTSQITQLSTCRTGLFSPIQITLNLSLCILIFKQWLLISLAIKKLAVWALWVLLLSFILKNRKYAYPRSSISTSSNRSYKRTSSSTSTSSCISTWSTSGSTNLSYCFTAKPLFFNSSSWIYE